MLKFSNAEVEIDPTKLTVNEVLDIIDQRLAVMDTGSEQLQRVLAILRGPDHKGAEKLKGATTAPLRTALFPKTYAAARSKPRSHWDVDYPGYANPGMMMMRPVAALKADARGESSHFNSHIYSAIATLSALGRLHD